MDCCATTTPSESYTERDCVRAIGRTGGRTAAGGAPARARVRSPIAGPSGSFTMFGGGHDDRTERDYRSGGFRAKPSGSVHGTVRLFVHNLSYRTSWQDLKDHARLVRALARGGIAAASHTWRAGLGIVARGGRPAGAAALQCTAVAPPVAGLRRRGQAPRALGERTSRRVLGGRGCAHKGEPGPRGPLQGHGLH